MPLDSTGLKSRSRWVLVPNTMRPAVRGFRVHGGDQPRPAAGRWVSQVRHIRQPKIGHGAGGVRRPAPEVRHRTNTGVFRQSRQRQRTNLCAWRRLIEAVDRLDQSLPQCSGQHDTLICPQRKAPEDSATQTCPGVCCRIFRRLPLRTSEGVTLPRALW